MSSSARLRWTTPSAHGAHPPIPDFAEIQQVGILSLSPSKITLNVPQFCPQNRVTFYLTTNSEMDHNPSSGSLAGQGQSYTVPLG